MLYERIADLAVQIEDVTLEQREQDTSSGFTRVTSVVCVHGDDMTGRGEDVTYEGDEHEALAATGNSLSLSGTTTLDALSTDLDGVDLFFGAEPKQSISRRYRQWAFESAALDLALQQHDTDLATQLDRVYEPVRFVVSTRLEDPPTGDRVYNWLAQNPALEFKLDPTSDWTDEIVERLRATEAVTTLDLKGQYHGTSVDQPADPALYERVIEGFPQALIEDPAITEATKPLLADHADRVTWDYPIRSVSTIEDLPWEPRWLNIKPSRFGSLQALFDTIDYCNEHDIRMFGGGQFELDVGREHLHALASLFYPAAPNDVAPTGYNHPELSEDLPTSPLEPPADPRGLRWPSSS